MTDEQRVAFVLARRLTAEAVDTLVAIMMNPKASASARVSAACAILDRGWGRVPQFVEMTNSEDNPFSVAQLPPEVATQIYLERVRGQIPR